MTPAAVLWDADGVLQRLPPFSELWPSLAPDVRRRLLAATIGSDEQGVLTGRVDMQELVETALADDGLEAHREEILEVWSDFPPVPEARELLASVRAAGTTCVLASNQDSLRATHMRPVYAPLLDRLYLSPEIGLAKPDGAFFRHVADDLGHPPDTLVFVDDNEENAAGAGRVGLHAIHWHFSHGISRLRAALESADVPLG